MNPGRSRPPNQRALRNSLMRWSIPHDQTGALMDRDLALIERLERLYPAVVSDCLDRLGVRMQVLEPHIRPLYTDAKVAGYAATVHCVDVETVPEDRADWYRGEMSAVDSLKVGDVMVVST